MIDLIKQEIILITKALKILDKMKSMYLSGSLILKYTKF